MNQYDPASQKIAMSQWARNLLSSNALILDFETTGLHGADIVQIGIVDMNGNTTYETLVKPAMSIPSDATRVHGITNTMVENAPTFETLYIELSVLLAGRTVIAYNADFDKGILNGVCKRRSLPLPRIKSWECAMRAYARYYMGGRGGGSWQSLSKACMQQNIPIENAHTAVADCIMTWKIMQAMAGHNG
jgi:DNA polymerase-3 subunit epsilon